MGKYRSKSGCLTCRHRRVKCDEAHPVCKQCSKKGRDCQWEPAHSRFRGYQPAAATAAASSSTTTPGVQDEAESGSMEMDDDGGEGEGEGEDGVALSLALGESAAPSLRLRNISRPGFPASDAATPSAISSSTLQQLETRAPVSPFLTSPATSTSTAAGGGGAPIAPHFYDTLPFGQPRSLEHDEAFLVHHYAEHLGRWLDGTDPARQFTLRVPVQVKHCSILLHSVLCFAARHRGNHVTADRAYQRCIALLIDRLNLNVAAHDDNLLCAIVILRFFEQLNVPSISGSDNEQHLAGSAAILRASQTRTVDPSSPTLREAAFWVYVRQCLYNATINQQPPNIDSSLELEPDPSSMRDHHPLATLRLETAWANQITWHCASIVNFCFDGTDPSDRSHRGERWQQLWDMVERWGNNRPSSFEPIWSGNHTDGTVFPLVWFAADWHVIAFGFYHFACILLLSYKPGPKFAIRTVGSKLSDTDNEILEHAHAICGSCKSSPTTVPCLITLCHTIFIWGPLLTDSNERSEVLQILEDFELTQRWPTTWIVNALKDQWGIE